MIRKIILVFLSLCFVFQGSALASEEKYITIVNPVRISKYLKNPAGSLKSEYAILNKNNLPATWLFTYDSLNDLNIVNEINEMDKNQEFGVFLEITETFATEANVNYHNSGSWHHANSVFLSGYTQEERIKLIDKIFEKYKEIFGMYPKSIGGWWTDAYSLSYMKDKYEITANLVCSDQFSTDGYKIWGQPWQVPYYPSKNNPAVPAASIDKKLDLVNIQWASRDPLNGYQSSLYSTQDYLVAGNNLDTNYFKKMIDLYLNVNDFSQITVGLEADLDPNGYSGEFERQIELVKKYSEEGTEVVSMTEFHDKYQKRYPQLMSVSKIKSKDLLSSNKESYWHNSPYYRLHYVLDTDKDIIEIKDIRLYGDDLIDPYFSSPNYEFNLSINIPPIIDSMQNSDDIWILPKGSEIEAMEKTIIIRGKNIKIPKRIQNNVLINTQINDDEVQIKFNEIGFNDNEGEIIKGFTSEALHFFKQKKSIIKLIMGEGRDYFNKMGYLIPQGEIYALNYLKSLPIGRVMVSNNECLQCSWHTKNKPIVFSNQRNYVKKYSKHPIVYNSSVFDAKTIEDLKKEFDRVNAKYIYLVKFENYIEKLPFSPGDLGIEKIYSNANAEIWKVK